MTTVKTIGVTVDAKSRQQIDDIAAELKRRFSETSEILREPRKNLWRDLGKIHEDAGVISAKPALRLALIEKVKARDDLPPPENWDPSQKSTIELLLILATGYEDKESSRSQYLAALRNASRENVPNKEAAFAAWVQKKHGIINAGKMGGPNNTPVKSSDWISMFAKKLVDEADALAGVEPVPLPVTFEGEAGGEGLGVFLVQKLPTGEVVVRGSTGNLSVVASAIRAIDPPLTPAAKVRTKRRAIWVLNRVVLKIEGLWRQKPEKEDLDEFRQAVQDLKVLDAAAFEGPPEVEIDEKTSELIVQNRDAGLLDPARYIKNAKPLKLVPYELDKMAYDPNAKKAVMKEALDKVPGFLAWRENEPRKPR